MWRLFENKRILVLTAVLALFSLVLLAGSLNRVDFRPAESLGGSSNVDAVKLANMTALIKQAAEIPFWRQAAFWAGLFVIVLLIASLLDPELRKKLILTFIRIAIFALGFLYLVKNNPTVFEGLFEKIPIPGNFEITPQVSNDPAPVFEPPQVSNWVSYVVALGLVLLAALFFWWLSRTLKRIKELSSTREPLDQLAGIARASLGELKSGANFENAIVECYARMSAVVDEKKGLHREHAMTPNEFAARLARAGLPLEPVEKLTRLFEAARYGAQRAGQAEIDEAVTSLTSILRHCGEKA